MRGRMQTMEDDGWVKLVRFLCVFVRFADWLAIARKVSVSAFADVNCSRKGWIGDEVQGVYCGFGSFEDAIEQMLGKMTSAGDKPAQRSDCGLVPAASVRILGWMDRALVTHLPDRRWTTYHHQRRVVGHPARILRLRAVTQEGTVPAVLAGELEPAVWVEIERRSSGHFARRSQLIHQARVNAQAQSPTAVVPNDQV